MARPLPEQFPDQVRLIEVEVVAGTVENCKRGAGIVRKQRELIGVADDVVVSSGRDQGWAVERGGNCFRHLVKEVASAQSLHRFFVGRTNPRQTNRLNISHVDRVWREVCSVKA